LNEIVDVITVRSSHSNGTVTRWFKRLVLGMLAPVVVKGMVSVTAVDSTGGERTFVVRRDIGGWSWFFDTYYCPNVLKVRIGSSSVTPTRGDFKLGSELAVDPTPYVSINWDEGVMVVEGRFAPTTDITVCEVGLSFGGTVYAASTCGEVLIDRSVLPACRTIPKDNVYVVRYVIGF